MEKHIFEQAADILDVHTDATPTMIRSAYHRAKQIAEKPVHMVRMAYDLLITSTAAARVHAVRLFHQAARTHNSLHIQKSGDALALDTRKECMEAYGRTGSLERSIAYLHLSFGHY